MSLSDPNVRSLLHSKFVLGWKNIRREDYVGDSFGYSRKQSCVGTTNGAGGRNVQIFMIAADRTVLHAMPGFWHPADLARHLRLGLVAHKLWGETERSVAQRRRLYSQIVLTDLRYQPAAMFARSDWQSFDMWHQAQVRSGRPRDAVEAVNGKLRKKDGRLVLKPLNVLTHQRMAARAFLKFEDFDIAAFVDYGTRFYDNNRGVSGRGRKLK